MLVPPPSVPSNPSSTPIHPLFRLASMLKDLSSLIHAIALPKVRTAKTRTILLDILHKACNLIISAVDTHKQQHAPQITSIIEQLDAILNHIGLPSKAAPFTTPIPPHPSPYTVTPNCMSLFCRSTAKTLCYTITLMQI
ncbi:hypothetical protein M422DRAFT_255550 [Sphaerobolus stellatus SS14]|uniref:Uncharacterized protein n=1 Tax=Sphaerobolus stellatus (strain SS14) TaxID=990650 RepID=A0A0C9V312_SPHS4|nr:hypothetical protein M422DRAFT_255550 [Sphaerobolus stellatus SS14]